jgi:ribonucleoside-triphosphate reductase (thioredoxin)
MASTDKLINICKDLGYHVEYAKNFDGTEDRGTMIVSFPCSFKEGTILAKDMSATAQLELVKKIQTVWADNAVSVTVYYKKEEIPEIKAWLKANYEKSLKSVSFLLHSDHGFNQAPYEEISEDEYRKMIQKVKPVSNVMIGYSGGSLEGLECVGGVCPVK